MRNFQKGRLVHFALSLVGLFLALLLVELGLRIIGFSEPSLYTRDPVRGWMFRPGAEGRWRREGDADIRINSQGYRDREHSTRKPPNTIRVAVLGDSVMAALQLPVEKTFCTILERKLSGCGALAGKKVEVINFGVSGYGTAQELLTLRHQVWDYEPDVVLLSFYTGNDIRNNYRSLNEDASLNEGLGVNLNSCPYFVYKDGHLVLDNSFLKSPLLQPEQIRQHNFAADLMNHFRFLQLMNWASHVFTIRQEREQAKTRLTDPHRTGAVFGCAENQPCMREKLVDEEGVGLDNLVYYPAEAEAWKEAWRVTEGLLLQMRDEVQQHGVQFWITIDTASMQVYPDPAVREAFMKKLGIDTLLYPDLRIRALAERENIRVIMLAPQMASYAEAHHVFLHGFENTPIGMGHWNETGHRVAADIVAEQLCATLNVNHAVAQNKASANSLGGQTPGRVGSSF